MVDDEPRPALCGRKCPQPLQRDADSQTPIRQKCDMYGGPREPGDDAMQPQLACLQYGIALSHDGHVAFVEIAKWARRGSAGDAALDEPADVSPLLDGHLGDTGE